MELERMGDRGTDPGGEDVCTDIRRLYCGGSCAGGGTVAPCTFCEWCGICPQHFDVAGGPAGSRKETACG